MMAVFNRTELAVMPHTFTSREIAELLGVEAWRIRRLFEVQAVPEPPRFAGKRAIPREMIPDVAIALRDRGWLPKVEPASTLEAGRG